NAAPHLPEPGIVLGLVEAWPSSLTNPGKGWSDGQPRQALRATPAASCRSGRGEVPMNKIKEPWFTRRGLGEETLRWRTVFPARSNTGDPFGPVRGLAANQVDRALISMVARSDELLQSEAGYIDARPTTRMANSLETHGRTIHMGHTHRR